MLWCRFETDGRAWYGVVEGETVVAIEGEPFGRHRRTDSRIPLASVRLLVPVIPPTFYAIGSNYRNHVIERSKVKGFKEPKFYDRPRVGYRANSALIAYYGWQARQTHFPVARLRDATIDWSSYERMFAWLNANSQQQDVFAAELDSMIALYTNRRAFRPFVYDPGHLFYGQPRDPQAAHRAAAQPHGQHDLERGHPGGEGLTATSERSRLRNYSR